MGATARARVDKTPPPRLGVERSRQQRREFRVPGYERQAILAARPEAAAVRAPFRARAPRTISSIVSGFGCYLRRTRPFARSRRRREGKVAVLAADPRRTNSVGPRVMGRALFFGAGFLEAAIAGTIHALPMDVATSADVALLECSVPVPMVLPDPSSSGEKKISGARSTRPEPAVGLEWRADAGRDGGIASLGGGAGRDRPRISGRASRCSPPGRERIRAFRRLACARTRSSSAAANERRRGRSEPSIASTTSTSGTSSTACVDNAMQLGAALASVPGTKPRVPFEPKVMVPGGGRRVRRARPRASSARSPRRRRRRKSSRIRKRPTIASRRAWGASLAALRGLVVKEMRAVAPTTSTRSKPTPGFGWSGFEAIATSADAPPRVTYAVEWLARALVAVSDEPSIRPRRRSAKVSSRARTVDGLGSQTPARSIALAATLQNAGALAIRSSTRPPTPPSARGSVCRVLRSAAAARPGNDSATAGTPKDADGRVRRRSVRGGRPRRRRSVRAPSREPRCGARGDVSRREDPRTRPARRAPRGGDVRVEKHERNAASLAPARSSRGADSRAKRLSRDAFIGEEERERVSSGSRGRSPTARRRYPEPNGRLRSFTPRGRSRGRRRRLPSTRRRVSVRSNRRGCPSNARLRYRAARPRRGVPSRRVSDRGG